MKTASSLLIAIVASFCLFIYIPMVSYLANVNEFAFNGYDLFKQLFPLFFSSLALLFIVTRLCKNILPTRLIPLGRREICVSPFDVFLIFLLLCLWVEGSLLSRDLPAFDGKTELFTSILRMLADSALWLLLLALPLYYWKKTTAKLVPLTLGLCLLMAVGIVEISLKGDRKLPLQLDRYEVLENLRFHHQNNILIMVIDSLSLEVVKDLLENDNNFNGKFSDFIFFDNALTASSYTLFAVPSMLSAAAHQGGDYRHLFVNAFESPSSLAQTFKDLDYGVYISSLLLQYNTIFTDTSPVVGENSSRETDISLPLYCQLSFSFIPYLAKYLTEDYLMAFLFSLEPKDKDETKTLKPNLRNDKTVYDTYILPSINAASSDRPTIHFHHLHGAHTPYRFRKNGSPLPKSEAFTINGLYEHTEWVLKNFSDFLDELRKKELYEGLTLVLIADHGDTLSRKIGNINSRMTPVFMVKPAGRKRERLTFSDIPVSNTDIAHLLLAAHVNGNGENLDSFSNSLNGRRRSCFLPPDTLMMVQKEGPLTELTMEEMKPGEATVLLPGKKYMMDPDDTNMEYDFAFPAEINGYTTINTRGYSVSANSKLKFYFKIEANKPLVDIELDLIYWNHDYRPTTTWPLRVADATTGKVLVSRDLGSHNMGEPRKVMLENVSVEKGIIGIEFSNDHKGAKSFDLSSIKVFYGS